MPKPLSDYSIWNDSKFRLIGSIREIESTGLPAKYDPVLPINIVAYGNNHAFAFPKVYPIGTDTKELYAVNPQTPSEAQKGTFQKCPLSGVFNPPPVKDKTLPTYFRDGRDPGGFLDFYGVPASLGLTTDLMREWEIYIQKTYYDWYLLPRECKVFQPNPFSQPLVYLKDEPLEGTVDSRLQELADKLTAKELELMIKYLEEKKLKG